MNNNEIKAKEREEDLARLATLRPMDDDFMRCIFKDIADITRYYKETK